MQSRAKLNQSELNPIVPHSGKAAIVYYVIQVILNKMFRLNTFIFFLCVNYRSNFKLTVNNESFLKWLRF